MMKLNGLFPALASAAVMLSAVSCADKGADEHKVESLLLDKVELTLEEGLQETLHVTALPEGADPGQIFWISGDESVAVVEDGLVTALSEGNTKITARTESRMASCMLSVVRPVVTGITLDRETVELRIDESVTLTASVTPENVRDAVIEWSTDNAAIAGVTQKGVVTANGVGTAVITVRSGAYTDECEVTVLPVEAESVTLSKAELVMEEGDIETLVATVGPSNTTDKSVVWTSSNGTVASVNGGVVTAKSVGSAVITATCGKASGKCRVTVNALSSPRYAIGDIFEKDGKKGVVFYIRENGKHGKAVSVNCAPDDVAMWQSPVYYVGATSSSDGSSNSGKIRSCEGYPSDFPAFGWFDENYGTGWYFPAQEEVAEIMKHHSEIQSATFGYDVLNSWLATSTEASESEFIFLKNNYSGGYSVSQSGKDVKGIAEFRVICEF